MENFLFRQFEAMNNCSSAWPSWPEFRSGKEEESPTVKKLDSKMALGLPAIFEFEGVIVNFQENSRVEAGVLKMVRRIRPDWPKEDIILQRFTTPDSMVESILYGGYTTSKGEMVMIKVYNPDEVLPKQLSDEVTIMRLLAINYMGPRLFATFCNGFAFDYVPGIQLDYNMATDKVIYEIVASKVGEMHRKLSHYMGVKSSSYSKYSQPKLFDNLRTCLTKIPNQLSNPKTNARMKTELPSKSILLDELTELEARLVLSPVSPGGKNFSKNLVETPPVVFCHGNLSPSNIFFDPLRSQISLLHPEFSGPNYQSFEIAQHFLTLCGTDLKKIGRQEFVPAKEFQRRWCRHYLSAYKNVQFEEVSNQEVDQLYIEVQRFSLVFCLQEVIWSLNEIENVEENAAEDILQYGIQRYEQYHKTKYNILSFNI